MKIKSPRILVIAGPTASGKSDLAISLARKFNGEIISADSRQVYRGMDIGTGKVTKREQRLARHWLIDIASPTRQYTVAHFKRDGQKAIRDILRRGKLPIICGGTGFWIDALVYDQSLPDVKPNAVLRKELSKLSVSELFHRLKKLDPVRAKAIDRHNPVRLIRALEIVLTTGKPVPPLVEGHLLQSRYSVLYLALTPSRSTLLRRITKRLDARLRGGMVAEVQRLHASGARPVRGGSASNGVSWKRLESFGLEYRWVARYLQMKNDKLIMKNRKRSSLHSSLGITHLSLRAMRNALLADIIAYSKRQLTWWKRNKDIHWIQMKSNTFKFISSIIDTSILKR